MQTYTLLREFADSWFLIAMFCFFIGTCLYAFWPGLRASRDAAAQIPLRDEPTACTNDCANCACKSILKELEDG